MAQNIVNSLFGVTPNDIYDAYAAQDRRAAVDLMNNPTLAQMGIYYGSQIGSGLGRGVASLLGAEDPRLQQAKKIEVAKQQGFDTSSPEGLGQLASWFVQQGEPGLAQEAAAMRNKMLESQATVYAKTREQLPSSAKELMAAGYTPGTPEFQDKMKEIIQAGMTKASTVVNVNQQQESEFAKGFGKVQAEQFKKAYDTRDAAVETLGTLSEMQKLNDKDLITGSFSGIRAASSNFLNTIGLVSKSDASKLANSQQFDKMAGDLLLANIKKLGYNPSNADVQFLQRILPSLESSAEARQELINWMASKAKGTIDEVGRMEDYASGNNPRGERTLTGYTPKVANFSPYGGTRTATTTKSIQDISTEDLIRMRNTAK